MKPWRKRCEECSTSTTFNVHAINSTTSTLIYSSEEIARKCTNFSPNGEDAKCDLQKSALWPVDNVTIRTKSGRGMIGVLIYGVSWIRQILISSDSSEQIESDLVGERVGRL